MHTVLLTWNPGPLDEHEWTPEEWEDAMVVPYLQGRTVTTRWSVGRHVNDIEPGDTAFMLRQGDWGRGIVARGIIRSHPKAGPHWGKACASTNYVDVEWQEAVPTSLAIDVEELEMLIPEFAWGQVYGSGRQAGAMVGKKLSFAWDKYVRSDYVRARSELYTSDVWRNVARIETAALAR